MRTNVEARLQGYTGNTAPCLSVRAACRHAGFTLIELIAVITLIGMLAVAVIVVYDGVGEHAQDQLVRAEMQEIKKALQQFKRDVGRYPCMAHPADFTELILGRRVIVDSSGVRPECEGEEDDDGVDLARWNPEYARGWRGPYLTSEGNGYVTIGDELELDATRKGASGDRGNPALGNPEDFRPGIADPFVYEPVKSSPNTYFEWRPCIVCEDQAYSSWGRPYYVFDLHDPKRARIVSSGSNGTYESPPLPDAVDPEDNPICADIFDEDEYGSHGDDVILCLQ